jgi:tRNA G18 (ribose-2'-O)-methylase SpoU
MVGAEGPGLNLASLEQADLRVRIPIDGAVDSLNVVVAAGIALDRLRMAAGSRDRGLAGSESG